MTSVILRAVFSFHVFVFVYSIDSLQYVVYILLGNPVFDTTHGKATEVNNGKPLTELQRHKLDTVVESSTGGELRTLFPEISDSLTENGYECSNNAEKHFYRSPTVRFGSCV